MGSALYRADDRDLLTGVLAGESVHLDPAAILDGLDDAEAQARPHGLPNSIAQIVAHMCFWQEWFNACITSGFTGIPKHSAGGWPAVRAGEWYALRERYLRALEEARRIAGESPSLSESLLPADEPVPSMARESRGSGLLRAAVHNSHHLGQIITLRRLMGLWPPPGGTIAW